MVLEVMKTPCPVYMSHMAALPLPRPDFSQPAAKICESQSSAAVERACYFSPGPMMAAQRAAPRRAAPLRAARILPEPRERSASLQ